MSQSTNSQSTHPKAILTLILLIFTAGIYVGARYSPGHAPQPESSSPSLLGQLASTACYTSLAILGVLTLALAIVGGYYGKLKLDAAARTWKAQAAQQEMHIERQRTQLGDLTSVARLVQAPDGRLLLLKPGIATSPVTLVDPAAATRPDQASDQLALAAILSQSQALGSLRGGHTPDSLLLAAMLSRQPMDERVPANVRVLSAEEVRLLEDGRE